MYYMTKTLSRSLSLSLSPCLSVKGYPPSEKADNILQNVMTKKVVFIKQSVF